MIIKKHQIFIDAKSVRKVGAITEESEIEEEFKKLKDAIESEARENARMILEEAQKRADQIIKNAEEKAKKIIENAEKTYKDEIKNLRMERNKLKQLFVSISPKIDSSVERISRLSLPVLKVIYKKILEKDIDEDLAIRRLKSALATLYSRAKILVKMNPNDINRLEDVKENLPANLEIIPDPSLREGDVIIETDLGILDKTGNFRWKMIEDIIDEIL